MRPALVVLFIFNWWISQGQETRNIFLVTLDGLRWQEVFGGAVDSMMNNEELTRDRELVYNLFHADEKSEARQKLMPWIWSEVAEKGQVYGNRWEGNKVNCTNRFWFSYPGYNEILTGFSDPEINSNAKKYNKNVTVLEYLNRLPEYSGKVAAFGSWDVFPFIINDERSNIPVNAGFEPASEEPLSVREVFLNELQDEIPSPWTSVRLDAFTHHYMMEYIKKKHPRIVYVSYGETDDFAHDGRYDYYLRSAHQTDRWLSDLWNFIQSDPYYKDKTSILITTDHGRGHSPMEEWKSHGTIFKGSNEIWIAALGPGISAKGEIKEEGQWFQNQIASTLCALLGIPYDIDKEEVGTAISQISGQK